MEITQEQIIQAITKLAADYDKINERTKKHTKDIKALEKKLNNT